MADSGKTSNNEKSTNMKAGAAERHADNAAQALDAKLSGPLAPLELALDDIFGKKASYQLPKSVKDAIVQYAPWLVLLFGALSIFSAYSLWRAAYYYNELADSLNRFSQTLGVEAVRPEIGVMLWLSLGMILLSAALAFMAFPGLKARRKLGWNILFYSLVVNVGYGVISLFYDRSELSSPLGTIIVSVICCYVLFQVRERYKA